LGSLVRGAREPAAAAPSDEAAADLAVLRPRGQLPPRSRASEPSLERRSRLTETGAERILRRPLASHVRSRHVTSHSWQLLLPGSD
jgi:hypothetical protein